MARAGGLGKGLGALIPMDSTTEEGATYQELPLDAISVNK